MSDDESSLAEFLARAAAESLTLRMGAQLPAAGAPAGQLLAALLDVRSRLDRLEELLITTLGARGLAARRHTAVRSEVDDAWDQAAVRNRSAGVRDEYSSAKERAAVTNLEVLDLRRIERSADNQLRRCDETVEAVRLRLRGLQELRQDLLAVIRINQFESTLER